MNGNGVSNRSNLSLAAGQMRNMQNIWVGKPEGKRPFGRPRHRWEDTKMNLMEVEWEGVDWMDLPQDSDPNGRLS
jgi:hypothetical protein